MANPASSSTSAIPAGPQTSEVEDVVDDSVVNFAPELSRLGAASEVHALSEASDEFSARLPEVPAGIAASTYTFYLTNLGQCTTLEWYKQPFFQGPGEGFYDSIMRSFRENMPYIRAEKRTAENLELKNAEVLIMKNVTHMTCINKTPSIPLQNSEETPSINVTILFDDLKSQASIQLHESVNDIVNRIIQAMQKDDVLTFSDGHTKTIVAKASRIAHYSVKKM